MYITAVATTKLVRITAAVGSIDGGSISIQAGKETAFAALR